MFGSDAEFLRRVKLNEDLVEAISRGCYDDRAIRQLTLIAFRFNYVNRVADAPVVGRE